MSAFAQTNNGDLDISTGNLTVATDVAQVTAWKLSNLFAFFKGEWFRDARLGIPYFQYVYVSNPNLQVIASIFDRVLRLPSGVAGVSALSLDYQPRARTLDAEFKVDTNDGAVLVGGLGVPFIIEQRGA